MGKDTAIISVETDEAIDFHEKTWVNRGCLETKAFFETFGKVQVLVLTSLFATIKVAMLCYAVACITERGSIRDLY
jgi:hypothetical protein